MIMDPCLEGSVLHEAKYSGSGPTAVRLRLDIGEMKTLRILTASGTSDL